jgi:predicted nucleic acid-binding protein
MDTFLDTSALLALLDEKDARHSAARQAWEQFLQSNEPLVTSNYVIVETLAVCQRRFGLGEVQLLVRDFLPAVEVLWINEETHRQGLDMLLNASQRDLSLIDCTSFILMRKHGIQHVFALDRHFRERGFECLP